MRRSLKIGLTGGIGSGKSSALEAFRRLGAATVSLDEMSHRLSRPGGVLYRAIVRAFGRRYLDSRGRIDRKTLGQAVFSRPALRRKLERATHPFLLREMRREIARAKRPVVVADVPLLFEAGVRDEFDVTMAVSVPAETAVRRVMRRDRMPRAQVVRRMWAQMPIERKARLADVVVANQQGPKKLLRAVGEYYRAFELIAGALRGKRF